MIITTSNNSIHVEFSDGLKYEFVKGHIHFKFEVSTTNAKVYILGVPTAASEYVLIDLYKETSITLNGNVLSGTPAENAATLFTSFIDVVTTPIHVQTTQRYNISEIDNTALPAYYGYMNANGDSLIKRQTATTMRYFKGLSANFTTNWNNRASLTYVTADQIDL